MLGAQVASSLWLWFAALHGEYMVMHVLPVNVVSLPRDVWLQRNKLIVNSYEQQ